MRVYEPPLVMGLTPKMTFVPSLATTALEIYCDAVRTESTPICDIARSP